LRQRGFFRCWHCDGHMNRPLLEIHMDKIKMSPVYLGYSNLVAIELHDMRIYTVSPKNWATFIFTVTSANVGRFFKFFQCRNQKEMAHNKNEKFPAVA